MHTTRPPRARHPGVDGRFGNADGSKHGFLVCGSNARWSPSGDHIAWAWCFTATRRMTARATPTGGHGGPEPTPRLRNYSGQSSGDRLQPPPVGWQNECPKDSLTQQGPVVHVLHSQQVGFALAGNA